MNIELFNFDLPKSLIAQHPHDIVDLLDQNSVLVLNDSKVIPARLIGIKEDTHAAIEVLLLKEVEKDQWEALTKPARRVKVGTIIFVSDELKLECIGEKEEGIRLFKVFYEGLFIECLERLGSMPLPPYITERLKESDRYQTVYAKDPGSAAAPTAGLHFTKDLLQKIEAKGIDIIPITLHVGLGTFKPVSLENIKDHHMHKETYTLKKPSAERLNQAKKEGKKIICVGTTSIRTLESNYQHRFVAGTFETDIYIYPGYQFKTVDGLITNFHLPKSTLIMLISAYAGLDFTLKAYKEAIKEQYRFFSFGDAMFIKTSNH